jgi:heat shock protein HslJ
MFNCRFQHLHLAAAVVIAGCQPPANHPAQPSSHELANATYAGVMEEPIALRDGSWQGEPFVSDGAARPTAGLVGDFAITGDLSGDGNDETVVLLWSNSGGSGTFDYLALLDRQPDGTLVNISTVPLGDRVDVRSAAISAGELIVDVVQAGPDDAACCPGEKLRRHYALTDGTLTATRVDELGRLSSADLGSVEWRLQQFDRDGPVPDGVAISLLADGDLISGSSGCNRYSGSIKAGEQPGTFTVAMPMISTLMACPPPADELEHQYLQQLQGATGFSFRAGKLALNWRLQQDNNTRIGTMLYTPHPLAADETAPK